MDRKPGSAVRASCAIAAAIASSSFAGAAAAEKGVLPNGTYTNDLLGKIISPAMGAVKHNQPSVVNGHLMLAGNAKHEIWDISDPFHPEKVSDLTSPFHMGEAESHQVAYSKTAGGRTLFATTSGHGIDLWDVTDVAAPALLAALEIDGIDYGDNTEAVWGLSWQGDYVFVGGTTTGLIVVDAGDPTNPRIVAHLPTSDFGGVVAGPLFAVGNLLLITTPKDFAGLATLDIGDPGEPRVLDFEVPEENSYIGGFFGKYAHLLTPFRTYDVTTDPTNIVLVGSSETEDAEYMSFGDGLLFMGALRPAPGVAKIDISDPNAVEVLARIQGREGLLIDDQFSIPIGNLLVMSDDERAIGSVIAVHDTERDSKPPAVEYVNPVDGATKQPLGTRLGISFSDQVDLTSAGAATIVVRPVGGDPLGGRYGHALTVLSFWPDEPLEPNTTYEIVLPKGGVTDLVGNPLAEEFRSVFSTGDDVTAPTCELAPPSPREVGATAVLEANPTAGAFYRWDFGDGSDSGFRAAPAVLHEYAGPGRYSVTLTVKENEKATSCTAIQVVHRALPAVRPTRSSTVAVDEARRRAWVVNPDADTVAAVDLTTLSKALEISVGAEPSTLAIAPDDTVWVVSRGSATISVLDASSGDLVATIPLPRASMPYGVAATPDGERMIVTLEATGTVLALDPVGRCVVESAALGPETVELAPKVRGIAITSNSKRALIPRFISQADRGEIFEVDLFPLRVSRTIALAPDTTADAKDGGRGVPNTISTVTISPDGTAAWIPSKKDNTSRGLARDGVALNTDNTNRTIVSMLDLDTRVEVRDRRHDLDDHDMAFVSAVSPYGDVLFVASQGTNQVDAFDAYDGKQIAGFSTGLGPQGLDVTSDGLLLVQTFLDRTLEVFDVSGILAGTDGAAKRVARVRTIDDESLDDAVLLGKQIFYNADTRQMNQDGYTTCASCHLGGGEDGRVWDFTDRGEGLRNTITLVGRGGTRHGPVHWTGNFDEIQDFENDIRNHFGGGGLMADADFEWKGRSDPLGDPKAGLSAPLDALAAYVASLDEMPRSPYRNQDGTFTEEAREGKLVFESSGCASCHSGDRFTDSALGTLHDVGTIRPKSGSRRGATLEGFDTPTLIGVWSTPPYLHDGSAATLDAVLDNPRHGETAALTPVERQELVQYMRELEDPRVKELAYEQTALCSPPVASPPATSTLEPAPVGGCGCRLERGSSGAGGAMLLVSWLLGRRLRRRRAPKR